MHFFNKTVLFVFVSLHVLPAKGTDISADQKALNFDFVCALTTNQIDKARGLLIRGAHINFATPTYMHRSLHLAAQCGRKEMLELLLAHGADVDDTDTFGNTALMKATCRGNANPAHTSCVKILLEHKAAINATTCSGYTALMAGALIGHQEITKLLVDHGADANIISKKGLTAAMIADKEGHTEVAKMIRWSTLRSAWVGVVCKAQEPLDLD